MQSFSSPVQDHWTPTYWQARYIPVSRIGTKPRMAADMCADLSARPAARGAQLSQELQLSRI